MDLQLQLNGDKSAYSNHEVVSGELVLRSAIPLQISGIVVTLKGSARSSLKDERFAEQHELFRRRQRVFPPPAIAQFPDHPGLTVGAGTHRFPFSIPVSLRSSKGPARKRALFSIWKLTSIKFSQVSECYKTEDGDTLDVTCTSGIRCPRPPPLMHLLRRLPPSTGPIGTSGEIKFTLDAEVTPAGRFKSRERTSCIIAFQPLSDSLPLQPPSKQIQSVTLDPEILGSAQPVSFHVETRLAHGPCLLRGQPIPLQVALTRTSPSSCSVQLDDFQTMLVETTQVRVREDVEHVAQVWVVQTVANLEQSMPFFEHSQDRRPVWVSSELWQNHPLPEGATSSFETCNLRRTHRLEVRLGFRFQVSPMLPSRLVVFVFWFPIYLISASSAKSPGAREKMGCEVYEDAVYKEGLLRKSAVRNRAVEVEDNRRHSIESEC
ncbi:uncharacterized protein KD926_001749 [Aspergillus affinis]|uniref:uncharacterized protein n=1 Tax=Aspergillus affinis TaxID=1070780 RepID=UPI0022FF2C07|nr:uncharacterized protein KD926_001749 [Aspergillus affinis]KAI9036538.1 hypothetical protein KD926_001749 [Aspergillus affinis]